MDWSGHYTRPITNVHNIQTEEAIRISGDALLSFGVIESILLLTERILQMRKDQI